MTDLDLEATSMDMFAKLRDEEVWYVAHPVQPTPAQLTSGLDSGDVIRRNVRNARAWVNWLGFKFPKVTFIAPWTSDLEANPLSDLDPQARARGLRDCSRVVSRCDGLVLVGGRVSSGMREESASARKILDLTSMGYDAHRLPSRIQDQPAPVQRDDLRPVWPAVIVDAMILYNQVGHLDREMTRIGNLVLSDMADRDRIGRERYGVPLTANNGRNQRVDLYQELLDAAAYCRAALSEQPSQALASVYSSTLSNLALVRAMIPETVGGKP